MNERLQTFLDNPLADQIEYCILWGVLSSGVPRNEGGKFDFSQEEVSGKFLEDMGYLVDNLLDDDNYFELQGRPVVYLYEEFNYVGPLEETFNKVEELTESTDGIFWIGDNRRPFPSQKRQRQVLDGINDYNPLVKWVHWLWTSADDWKTTRSNLEKRYFPFIRENYFHAQEEGKYYIPTLVPGFNKPASDMQVVRRNLSSFRYEIDLAKRVIDRDINTIFITSFNEWLESTSVEPAKEWGLDYLNVIREELAGYTPEEELKEHLDHLEFRFNKTVDPGETGGRKMSIRPSVFEFSDSPNFVNPEFELDIGDESGMEYLGRGWSVPEEGNGRTWRWSSSSGESSIFIPKSKELNYMKFEAIPISDDIEADVYLNGELVGHINFEKGWQIYTVELSN